MLRVPRLMAQTYTDVTIMIIIGYVSISHRCATIATRLALLYYLHTILSLLFFIIFL